MEEVYFEEVEYYLKRIKRDSLQERLADLAVVHNPNAKDPNKLVNNLRRQLQELEGKAYLFKERMSAQDERQLREIARQMKENAAKRRRG